MKCYFATWLVEQSQIHISHILRAVIACGSTIIPEYVACRRIFPCEKVIPTDNIIQYQMKTANGISVTFRTTVGPQCDVIQSNFVFGVSVDLHLQATHSSLCYVLCIVTDDAFLFLPSVIVFLFFSGVHHGGSPKQWLKWSCEAGRGGGSPDEVRLEQTPYPFHTQLIWRYLGIK